MSDSSPKRSLPTPPQTAHAQFTWPPPDEELAECFYSGIPDEQLAQGGVEPLHEATPLETSAQPIGTPATLPAVDDSTVSDLAVAQHSPALNGTSGGQWAAEIAQLQALLEALTERVDWRKPIATRR